MLAFFERTDVPEEIFIRAWRWGEYNRAHQNDVESSEIGFDIRKLSTRHFELALSFDWADPSDLSLFKRARARLDELSLISLSTLPNVQSTSISMHPVLHSWARNRLSEVETQTAWNTAAATLALSAEHDFDLREFTHQLQPHLEVCCDARPPTQQDSRELACRTLYLFWHQLHRAGSGRIVSVMTELQSLVPSSSGGSEILNQNSVRVLKLRARMLKDSESHVEALAIQQRLLRTHESNQEEGDDETRWYKFSVASTLYDLERYDEAAQTLEDSLATDVLDHHDICQLMTLERLGASYLALGDPNAAVNILEEAVEIGRQLPEQHIIQVLSARQSLASAYRTIGMHLKAIRLAEEVVTSKRQLLPPGNQDRWGSEALLVQSYTANGQLTEARQLFESMTPFLRRQTQRERNSYQSLQDDLLIKEFENAHISGAETIQEQSFDHDPAYHKLQLELDEVRTNTMMENWTPSECQTRRRIVKFCLDRSGSVISATFQPPNYEWDYSCVVSCIWWDETQECYVTSADTIRLLDLLQRHYVEEEIEEEEKTRIRRNLERFQHATVSKTKPDSMELWKLITRFGYPRAIFVEEEEEEDIMVLPWRILATVLKQIFGEHPPLYISSD